MINRFLHYFFFCTFIIACSESNIEQINEVEEKNTIKKIDFQGHRGCRGLLPENTLPAFKKALDLGVTTLEMDVVITQDEKVILSHEPWFSHEIALDSNGSSISEKDERNHRIFAMTFDEIQAYDVGMKPHPRFPNQAKVKATKPLLSEVFSMAETHATETSRALPYYNIETKSLPEGDGIFHPKPEEFVDLLVAEIKNAGVEDRTVIQSFDVRTLQVAKEKYPEIQLVLLVENTETPEENLKILGFTPDIYSPDYTLVNEGLISFAREKGMKIIPWTVNEREEMVALIEMGVDGLITDYPDRLTSQEQ
ncbi:glycerophosphodiester phosphodiesterase [Cryomorphaceae bacterium 1068]|nr:glycerophosphodiester phosphodiesterase [Cryomorphaceae bacterium 1068]